MKHIRQYRFYGSGSDRNYPKNLSYGELKSGNIFKSCGAITHLGIQARPGTMFYLNGSNDCIAVGATGIFELNLDGLATITAIRFDKKSLDALTSPSLNQNNVTDDNGIIIDIVYEGIGVI